MWGGAGLKFLPRDPACFPLKTPPARPCHSRSPPPAEEVVAKARGQEAFQETNLLFDSSEEIAGEMGEGAKPWDLSPADTLRFCPFQRSRRSMFRLLPAHERGARRPRGVQRAFGLAKSISNSYNADTKSRMQATQGHCGLLPCCFRCAQQHRTYEFRRF